MLDTTRAAAPRSGTRVTSSCGPLFFGAGASRAIGAFAAFSFVPDVSDDCASFADAGFSSFFSCVVFVWAVPALLCCGVVVSEDCVAALSFADVFSWGAGASEACF